uniref:Uncharacterized protein n=1 Tax=Neogobius melanostomus TaxID=47308 RepID=A0A8C6UDW5_9GOBI
MWACDAVDRDFKCFLYESNMNCSWTSDPSSPVRLIYRECGPGQDFKECNLTNNSGPRTVCQLSGNFLQKDLCMSATTSNGISTFKAPKVLTLPKMTISEVGINLVLTWAPLEVEVSNPLCNICYSVCDEPRTCQGHSLQKGPFPIPYDKSCQYKIQYQIRTGPYSTEIYSDWSEEITYGFTDRTPTVVAIVIPIIVSACVILSCICFRRHKNIICPEVPDPSTIFKFYIALFIHSILGGGKLLL